MPSGDPVTPVQACLNRLAAGDPVARDDLIRLSHDRLLLILRAMLKRYPSVRRWEESDDVLQNVLIRLDRTLSRMQLVSTRDFLAIAATNIRRELIDLVRHYYGTEGLGANHATPAAIAGLAALRPEEVVADRGDDPAAAVVLAELHEKVAALTDDEREVFDLMWYHGLSQVETAAVLGVSERTVRRRWVAAKLQLSELLDGELPA